eukprot:51492_1
MCTKSGLKLFVDRFRSSSFGKWIYLLFLITSFLRIIAISIHFTIGQKLYIEENVNKQNISYKTHFFQISNRAISLRHRRSIESIFYHYNNTAIVDLYSNYLTNNSIQQFIKNGYNIKIIKYNLTQLLDKVFTVSNDSQKTFKMNKFQTLFSKSNNDIIDISDVLRQVILYLYGGIYLDTDVVVLKKMDNINNVMAYQSQDLINNAVLKFESKHIFIKECINELINTFTPSRNLWGYNGPNLVTRVAERFYSVVKLKDKICNIRRGCNMSVAINSNTQYLFTILDTNSFYPIHYANMKTQCFEKSSYASNPSLRKIIFEEAYVMHVNNKITSSFKHTKNGTLCREIFNKFCIFCDETV